jgi:hypothetical protein
MRPALNNVQDPTDITGWYWTKSELIQIARRLGVPRSGSKQDVIEAITASLAGREPRTLRQKTPSGSLQPPFDAAMVIPAGQPFTRELRNWVASRITGDVRVSAAVRELLRCPVTSAGHPATLGDLVELIENPPPPSDEIGRQFERNRFMRYLSRTEPAMGREQREREWARFRQLPSARRAAILGATP